MTTTDAHWLAQRIASALRPCLPDVAPDQDGRHDSYVTARSGPRKVDVCFSTTRHGLELGIWIVAATPRVDVERLGDTLGQEAEDFHGRQPHAVLVAYVLVFAPQARDGTSDAERVAGALTPRAGRTRVGRDDQRFEHVFVGSHDPSSDSFLHVAGDSDRPTRLSFAETLTVVRATHRARNRR